MTKGRKTQKIKRLLLPSTILLLMVALGVFWFSIPRLVINRLQSYTYAQSEGNYELSIADISRSIFPFSLSFKEVRLEPTEYNVSDHELASDEILYSFGAREIGVQEINLRLLLAKNILAAKKVKVFKPEVMLAGEKLLQVDSLDLSSGFYKKMWPLFGFVEKVDLRKIEFEEANFSFYSAAGDSNFISKAEKVSVDIHGFHTSSEMKGIPDKYFETEDILIRINDFRNDMGDSLHVLTIDTLYYSLKTTDISAKGFHLRPWSFEKEENLFEVKVPEVYVKSRSITHFALSDSLNIGFLEFSQPQIKFYQKEQPQKIELEDLHNFDLYSLIKSQFIKLEVDSFYLQEANVEIFRQPDTKNYRQYFQSIDIVLHGFELDSTSYLNQEKLLHADDLEMNVKGYHLRMKDEEHHFRAGSLFASTFSNRLGARAIEIHPEKPQNHNIRNEINIECKSLNIEEVNFLDLYHKRVLPTSTIEVTEPIVHLLYRLEKEKQKKQAGSGLLFEIVTDYLEGVYANSVMVKNGSLDIRNSHNGVEKGYFETKIDFDLSEFRLDSTSLQNTANFFYASGFNLQFADYNMRLVDNFHKIEADTISISSNHHQVNIENLSLRPVVENVGRNDMLNSGHSELFNISVPQIRLRGIDLKSAFFEQKINIADFRIYRPQIYFENFGKIRAENEKQEINDFYELLFSYIKDVNVGKFSISDGLLTWINHTRKGRTTSFDNEFSASLENFRLNKAELKKNRLLFSDNFDLIIKDQDFELSDNVHLLKGSEIRLSSSQSMIQIKQARLFPLITSEKYNELATTWQVAIPEINIEGFNFQKAWYSQEPEIKTIKLVNPRFQVYTNPEKVKGLDLKAYSFPMPGFIDELKVSEFLITNGKAVTYRKEGMQHQAKANFSFELAVPGLLIKSNDKNQVQASSSNIRFSMTDFIIPVDAIHNLQIGSAVFNRESQLIEVKNLKLLPYITDKSKNQFRITAPSIKFQDFDFNAALNENNFYFNSIIAKDTRVAITINKEIQNDTLEFLQTLDLYPYVEPLVNSIQVNNLEVNNAFLDFNWLEKQLFNNQLDLSFTEIMINKNSAPHNLLNSKEFTLSTTSLSATSRNGMYAYTADTFRYQSAGHLLKLKNIEIAPTAPREAFPLHDGLQTDVAEAKIEYLEFREIDERRWFSDNILDAGALVIGPANIEIFRNKRFPFDHSQRPEWPQDLIKKIKQPFVFDSVKLLPSRVKYSELLGIFNEPGYIEFTGLELEGNKLSNIPEQFNQHTFNVDARARLMGEGLISAHFKFDLGSNKYYHTVDGSLSPMNLEPLNTMVMKTAPLAVESGRITRMDFNLSFNEHYAEGEMFLTYNNLKIAVLDYSGDKIQKDQISTFVANRLKVNTNNKGGENHEPVNIKQKRDEKRSIINFWWKSLYNGVSQVIGI